KGSLEALQKVQAGSPVTADLLNVVCWTRNTNDMLGGDERELAIRAKLRPKLDEIAKRLFTTPESDKVSFIVRGGESLDFRLETFAATPAYLVALIGLRLEAMFEEINEKLNKPAPKKAAD